MDVKIECSVDEFFRLFGIGRKDVKAAGGVTSPAAEPPKKKPGRKPGPKPKKETAADVAEVPYTEANGCGLSDEELEKKIFGE